MAVFNAALFREQFPAFADPAKYPDAQIEAYWDMATMFISAEDSPYRTLDGKRLATALNMLTAHLLFLGTNKSGGATGSSSKGGFTTSATVGEVSVSKLAPPASDGWQWWLAGSDYGQMLWALLSVLSVGGLSVGGLPEREAFRKVGGVFW
jgi:hypothetical protein